MFERIRVLSTVALFALLVPGYSQAAPAWGTDIMPSVPVSQVAAAIQKEGSSLIVSGFSSGDVRAHYHPLWFEEWVRQVYGVPIHVQFVPAEGDEIIQQLKATKPGDPAPIDLMAIENMFVQSAIGQGLIEQNVLQSPLIPLAKQVPEALRMSNTALRFQGAEGCFMVYNPKLMSDADAAKIKKWTDVPQVYKNYPTKV